jgi:hypothetical protein
LKFVLSHHIEKAMRDDGFIGAIIYGAQRLGKSSYSAQVLYDIYHDWQLVDEHMVFNLTDVVDLLHTANRERRKIPALCWDDCGVHANKLVYFQDRLMVQYLSNLIDVVGVNLGGLLMTTPSPLNLLRTLRGYEFYRVKVYRRDQYNGRIAVGYQSVLLPSGTRLIKREFKDNFNVRLPDEFWNPYIEKRQGYLDQAIGKLQELAMINHPAMRPDLIDSIEQELSGQRKSKGGLLLSSRESREISSVQIQS